MAFIRIPIDIPELEVLMADVQEIKQKIDALSQAIDQMQQRVDEDVQALKDKLDQAGIDHAVLEEVNAGLDNLNARVQAIDPDPENPSA